jgi:hypothetical protein
LFELGMRHPVFKKGMRQFLAAPVIHIADKTSIAGKSEMATMNRRPACRKTEEGVNG